MTLLDDLPNEALSLILSYTPVNDESTKFLYLVCKRWFLIMESLVGRTMILGTPTPFMKVCFPKLTLDYYGGVDKINCYGVRKCYVGDFLDSSNSVEGLRLIILTAIRYIWGPNLPQFKYPHLLHHIEFNGPITASYFESMLSETVNLRQIVIHWSAVSTLDFKSINTLKLPSLELLYIWGTNLLISPRDNEVELFAARNFKGSSLFTNLKNFFRRAHFPKLRLLKVELPYNSYNEEELTRTVVDFLVRHSDTLWSLNYSINCDLSKNFRKKNLDMPTEHKLLLYIRDMSELLQKLKSLELTTLIGGSLPHFSLWNDLVRIQQSLESLSTEGTAITLQSLQRIIAKNKNSLKRLRTANLHLDSQNSEFNSNIYTPIDCQRLFNACSSLETVSLEGVKEEYARCAHHYYLRSQVGALVNCISLPDTITSLHLKWIAVESKEVANITLQLKHLKRLWLVEIGCTGTLGITYHILIRMLEKQRRFELLYISGGINGSFSETLRQYNWVLRKPPDISSDDMKLLEATQKIDPVILELNPNSRSRYSSRNCSLITPPTTST